MEEVEHKYRVMFNDMAQGAFYQLADGSLVEVNDAALEMFGIGRDTFLGRTSHAPEWTVVLEDGTRLSPGEHPSMVALKTGKPVLGFLTGVYNERLQAFTWLSINAIPMFRSGEVAPYQVFVTLHDVSQQKRTNDIHLARIRLMQFADAHTLQELLVAVLDELEKLTGSVIGFYHFIDEKTQHVRLGAWSTRTLQDYCRLEGRGHYNCDDAGLWLDCIRQGKPLVHNDYLTLPHRKGLPEGHAPLTREVVVPVIRNGRAVAVLGVGNKEVPYTDADLDTVVLFADLTWDITERKKGESRLLQANRQLDILTNTAMDGFWIFDATGRIVAANEAICQMYGIHRDDIVRFRLQDVEASENEEGVARHLSLIRERGYDRFETRMRHSGGEIIDVEVSATYLPESGEILAFNRDISARKLMEEELLRSQDALKQANELLEHRVSQRTADLQAAIQEQEAFSYSVSHDLRAPLRHINSYCQILMEDHAPHLCPEAREFLDHMKNASSRMGSLIDHLLNLSRVTRTEIRPQMVNLSELAAASLRMLAETEPHRRVEVLVEPEVQAMGDQHLLTQLIGNLLENAWKYTSRRAMARIEFGRIVVSGQETYFVTDNGAGFDMTYREKLFRPFERLHGAEFDGIGIGLATAQRIVKRHGGVIWAKGVAGKGASFYFTLAPPPMTGHTG